MKVLDLANIVPAVLTLAMMGIPLRDWEIYCEPTHAGVYTPTDSPDRPRVHEMAINSFMSLHGHLQDARAHPRPGESEESGDYTKPL